MSDHVIWSSSDLVTKVAGSVTILGPILIWPYSIYVHASFGV